MKKKIEEPVSPEEVQNIITEKLLCKYDFNYYVRNYGKIPRPGGDVLFTPYQRQVDLIKTLEEDHYVAVLKSRQIGISTILQFYISWLMTFYDNIITGILSKDGSAASDFSRKINSIISKLPSFMRPRFKVDNVQNFILENGSACYSETINPRDPSGALRGMALSCLVIDEAAFVPKVSHGWTGIAPALITAQKQARDEGIKYFTCLISTPNKTSGDGAWFYNRYMDAKAGVGLFKPFTIHWRDIPELANDPQWYEQLLASFAGDQKKIDQEMELKFLPSTGSFFPEDICAKIQDYASKSCIIEKGTLNGGEFIQYEKPIPGDYYLIGVDTATQYGDDLSAITVWNHRTLSLAWEFIFKGRVDEFCRVVYAACSLYPGTVVIERNSIGNQVVEFMDKTEFLSMIYKEKRGNIIKSGLNVDAYTRPLLIGALYEYITQFPEIVKSERLALELSGLVQKPNGRVEGESGSHDDMVFSAGLVFYVRKHDPPLLLETSQYHQDSFREITEMNEDSPELRMNNSEIIKRARLMVEDGKRDSSYIDVLDFYNKG